MAASQPSPAQDGSPPDLLQTLQQQTVQNSVHSRRLRPPTLESFARDANRVPLRPEKVQRRESKMGLRSLFGRSSRPARDAEPNSPAEPRPAGGIRASIVDFGSWPHSLQASRSEAHLSTISQSDVSSATGSNKSLPPLPTSTVPKRTMTNGKDKPINTTTPKAPKAVVATWNPPPLFQAYPQAIRHAHLPAPVMSADALIRHNNKKGGDLSILEDLNQTTSTLDIDEESGETQASEKQKKRHRRDASTSTIKLDWTTKVYVLVTSGCLLQYSGEGQFDRLPEKILQLSKSSAAFASDSIPGRHWVLQVCSAMEPDGTPASDSRSIFSRIPFRGEKRNASNFLMVFEDADDMESWIVLLRREIETLGGKKNLSETGKPKIVEALVSGSLRPQASQRTLVVRDPERFSRVVSPDHIPWRNEGRDSSDRRPETPPERSYDDISTTTSIVSHDGRQLENLRDSGNRLSYLSSGQRTVITSTGSSPAGSPVRESFSSEKDDVGPYAAPDVPLEPRPRPNAALISDRRQSMQSVSPIIDFRSLQPPPRPQLTSPDASSAFSPVTPQTIPNFSVPQSVGRRYSFVRSPTMEGQFPPPPLHAREPLMKGMRKQPPTALPMTRPLSTVADQPSPDSPHLRDSTHQRINETIVSEAPDSATIFSSWSHKTTKEQQPAAEPQQKFPARRSSFMPVQDATPVVVKSNPRRFSSMQALRSSAIPPESVPEYHTFYLPKPSVHSRGQFPVSTTEPHDDSSRCRSSMDSFGPRSQSPAPSSTRKSKCASMLSMKSMHSSHSNHSHISDNPSRRSMQQPIEVTVTEFDTDESASRSHHMSVLGNMSRSQQSLVPGVAKNLYNRRSMPQLADGPPPAPPPNCALPPIPQQHPRASASHWKTLRI